MTVKISRRSILALMPVGFFASEAQAAPLNQLITLEPGDWGTYGQHWRPPPPIVGKYHEAMSRLPQGGERVYIDLLDASKRRWLQGEHGFEADELTVESEAAFNPRRDDIILLTAHTRALQFSRHLYAKGLWDRADWRERNEYMFDKRCDSLWYIRISVVPFGGPS